jgi:hypothetical protein
MPKDETFNWTFKPRFRKKAFGWKSQPAITRIKEAVKEIKKVARTNSALGAEGAVIFLERLSPAIEPVDGSSGSIGNAVYNAIEELVPVIAHADAEIETREIWLERLWQAFDDDGMCYLDSLADHWGQMCAGPVLASNWADKLIDAVKLSWSTGPGGYFRGTIPCLSALFHAKRYDDLLELLTLSRFKFFPYHQWGAKALGAKGDTAMAIKYVEESRDINTSDTVVARIGEEILLQAGQPEDAYRYYAIAANQGNSYLSTFRTIAKKYPAKDTGQILADLIESTPGQEGKWFAAVKDAGILDVALQIAHNEPCDPRTLTRAARDYADSNPTFALGVGVAALRWLAAGYGYEVTTADVWAAYNCTMQIATSLGQADEVGAKIRAIATQGNAYNLVAQALATAKL